MKACCVRKVNGGKKRRKIKGCKRRYKISGEAGWEALGFAVIQNAFEEYEQTLYKEDVLKENIVRVMRENKEINETIDYYESHDLVKSSETYEALMHARRTELLNELNNLKVDWDVEQDDMKSLLNFMYYDKLGVGLLQFFDIDPDKIFIMIEDRYCQKMA